MLQSILQTRTGTPQTLRGTLLLCAMLALGFISNQLNAQVSGYAFSQSTPGYVPITGGTVLGTTASDDQYYVTTATPAGGTTRTGIGFPIGFTFNLNGQAFDVIGINNNGWVALGQSALGATAVNMNTTSSYLPLSSATAVTPAQLRNRIAQIGRASCRERV